MFTELGIGIGNSLDKVYKLYGTPDRIDLFEENVTKKYSVLYSYKLTENYYLHFWLMPNGKVNTIVYQSNDVI